MSILIKNMVMPKNCGDCPLFESKYHYHGCHAKPESFSLMNMWDFVDERPEWCPLVKVKPHGRLIDADAWIAKVREELLSPNCKKGALEIMGAMFRYVLDAPTIIEAETCNESCTLTKENPCKNGHEYLMNCAPTITESE